MLSFQISSKETNKVFNDNMNRMAKGDWDQVESLVKGLGGVTVGVRDDVFVEMLSLNGKWTGIATMLCPDGEDVYFFNMGHDELRAALGEKSEPGPDCPETEDGSKPDCDMCPSHHKCME
jgi:hypothetical protein